MFRLHHSYTLQSYRPTSVFYLTSLISSFYTTSLPFRPISSEQVKTKVMFYLPPRWLSPPQKQLSSVTNNLLRSYRPPLCILSLQGSHVWPSDDKPQSLRQVNYTEISDLSFTQVSSTHRNRTRWYLVYTKGRIVIPKWIVETDGVW